MDKVLFVGPLDRVLLLRTLPMLEGLLPVHIAAIAQHAKERFFPRDMALHIADEKTEAVHLIVEGAVEATREGGVTMQLHAGDAVGFIEMLSRSDWQLDVRAISDTVALELDWDAQIDVCEEHFPVVMQYVSYLAKTIVNELQRQSITEVEAVPLIATQRFDSELNLIERVLVLSRSQAFSSGCLDALSELAHHVTEVRWRPREHIWSIDDSADHFLLLASGSLRCASASGDVITYHAGNVIGLYEPLCDSRRWHDAFSIADTIAFKVDIEPFIDILEDHFDLALDFMAVLASVSMRLQAGETKLNRSSLKADGDERK